MNFIRRYILEYFRIKNKIYAVENKAMIFFVIEGPLKGKLLFAETQENRFKRVLSNYLSEF